MKKQLGTFFISWDQAFKSGAIQVGGKGWNLARLDRFGFKIPPGGVLSTDAYMKFIDYNGLDDDIADILDDYDGYNTVKGLKKLIDEARDIAIQGIIKKENYNQ